MKEKSIIQASLLVLISLVLSAISVCYFKPGWGDPEIELFRALDLKSKALWVDARSEDDYIREHIPGAVLLNQDQWHSRLPEFIEQYSEQRVVIVYCSSLKCQTSHEIARRLEQEAGIKQVRVLKGGWESWKGKK